MKKIVVAIDSFKGCASSAALAEAVEEAVKEIMPACHVCKIPIADGGEGTVDALMQALQGERVSCRVEDPLRRPVEATYGWVKATRLAIIEMAAASGLPLLRPEERDVMRASTRGVGQLITDAIHRGARHFLLGIGGSATNDAGTGMLRALGFRFLDKKGQEVPDGGAYLSEITDIDTTHILPELAECTFEVATDVSNPFYGPEGAAAVFAPQKGATPAQVPILDDGLRAFSTLVRKKNGIDLQQVPGSGAAGGLGGGCAVFLHARLASGIGIIRRLLHFDEQLAGADLVITGEGKVDAQTSRGKVVSGVIEAAQAAQVPVVILTGNCAEPSGWEASVPLFAIHPAPVSLEEAMDRQYTLRQTKRVVRSLLLLLERNPKEA